MLCPTCDKIHTCKKKKRFEYAVESTYLQAGEIPEEPLTFNACDGSILIWKPETGIVAEFCVDYKHF